MPATTAAKLLWSRRRLRAAATAFRRRPDRFVREREHAPVPELVELVEDPFASPGDADERLTRLEDRLRGRDDRRSCFLTIYTRMTAEVRNALHSGRFGDPAWMEQYLVTFANYYRRAFLAFERGKTGAVPDPWKVAFGTAVDGGALVVQDAFLGVNAHINYDLAFALDDVAIDPNREQKRADHREINDILAGLVDAQQRALADIYAEGIENVDHLFGRLDEAFTLFALVKGREYAWWSAVVLADAGWLPVEPYVREVVNATATGEAYFLLSPTADPTLMQALRAVEADRGLADVLSRVDDRIGGGPEP